MQDSKRNLGIRGFCEWNGDRIMGYELNHNSNEFIIIHWGKGEELGGFMKEGIC